MNRPSIDYWILLWVFAFGGGVALLIAGAMVAKVLG